MFTRQKKLIQVTPTAAKFFGFGCVAMCILGLTMHSIEHSSHRRLALWLNGPKGLKIDIMAMAGASAPKEMESFKGLIHGLRAKENKKNQKEAQRSLRNIMNAEEANKILTLANGDHPRTQDVKEQCKLGVFLTGIKFAWASLQSMTGGNAQFTFMLGGGGWLQEPEARRTWLLQQESHELAYLIANFERNLLLINRKLAQPRSLKVLADEINEGEREQLIKLFQEIANTGSDAKSPVLKRAVNLKIREMVTGEENTMANVRVWQAGVKIATDFASGFEERNGEQHDLLQFFKRSFDNKMHHTLAQMSESKRKVQDLRYQYRGQPNKKMKKPVTIQQLRDEIPNMPPTPIEW